MAEIILAADLQVADFFVLPAGLRAWGEVVHQVTTTRQIKIGYQFSVICYTAWASADRAVDGECELKEGVHVKRIHPVTSELAIAELMAMKSGEHLQVWKFGGRFYV